MSFNKIILVGNLGKDPELNYTPQGTAVCKLSVATSEKRRDKSGEMQDITTWFRVTLWEKRAETAAKYLQKGTSVYIEGRLRVEEWADKDGKNRHTLEVHATEMQFLGSNSESQNSGNNNGERARGAAAGSRDYADNTPSFTGSEKPSDDDIPF